MVRVSRVSDNTIGDEGATALASTLESNHTLRHLDIGRECRGDAGVWVVCEFGLMVRCDCAQKSSGLYSVLCVVTSASENSIGGAGATALASALKRNSTLQHLNVWSQWRRDGSCATCCVVVDDELVKETRVADVRGCVW
jgi:hypothetical protein